MAIQQDCAGCRVGEHDRHNRSEGLKPGLIGGYFCGCTGDCDARMKKAAANFQHWVRNSKPWSI